jgi:small redox-active disulfide protein 2
MKVIQILGMGCAKCRLLQERAEQAARELGLEVRVEKVTDLGKIAALGVVMTPALAVDGTVKVAGKVPDVAALKALLDP